MPDTSTQLPVIRVTFEKHLPQIEALPEDQLEEVNFDIPTGTVKMLAAIPRLRTLRAQLVERLLKHDMAAFDEFEGYTRALLHAHSEKLATQLAKSPELEKHCKEGIALRQTLTKDCESLVAHDLLDKGALDTISNEIGAHSIATDLLTFATILHNAWPKLAGQTHLKAEWVAHVEATANKIFALLGAPTGDSANDPASVLRRRAFTLFMRTYRETKRAVTYLRWYEDDVEDYCPSLWPGRRGKRSEGEAKPAEPTPPVADPVVPVPAGDGESGVPGGNPFTT